jgi:twitching motility protein PilT
MTHEEEKFAAILKVAVEHNASDVHVRSDEKPFCRVNGKLKPVEMSPFTAAEVYALAKLFIKDEEVKSQLHLVTEYDGSYELRGVARVRYNLMRYQGKFGLVCRIIKTKIPTVAELNLPESLEQLVQAERGIVLVTGATGCGKSSTLAAMIGYINANERVHIITIEDPVEYLHPQLKARVTQREIGLDTADFTSGMKFSLREDPDIILIGEMRDTETFSTALKASETGHLVLATVHTADAVTTIGRLLAMFPPEEQNNARLRFAENLSAIISQRLLPRADKKGMIPAVEILINGPGIRECLLGKEDERAMMRYMEAGKGQTGSQSFDQHLRELLEQGLISKEVASKSSRSEGDFLKKLRFEID